jgi:pellino protein
MASTAYQIGCMGLVGLGYAVSTEWGAIPKEPPVHPKVLPRWDDICILVLWLANQQNLLSYRLPDGGIPPNRIGTGFVIVRKDDPLPPPPNIEARHGLGPAFCHLGTLQVLEIMGLVSDNGWTKAAEFVLWRTSPKS